MKNYAWLAAVLIACGGDSVSDSKKLADLSQAEEKSVCQELADDFPERTVTCGDGFSFTIGFTDAECNETDNQPTPATCTATVGDIRDCTGALYNMTDAQLCMDGPAPASCAALTAEGC